MTQLSNPNLTPVQQNVIAAITGGASMKAAAEAAQIHRNTISYWRQTSQNFREALSHAQYDKALFIREEAETRVSQAFTAIDTLLASPDTSDAARLNAAKYIIEKASTPPSPKPEAMYYFEKFQPEIVHSNAQRPTPPAAQKSEIVHRNAQSPAQTAAPQPIRTAPKVGRNEPCPCGSHLKFKRCCLGKTQSAMAA
jgi:transposase-like protein